MYQRKILVAVVAGTKSEDVIGVLRCINEEKRFAVEEVTLDLSDSMRKIVRSGISKSPSRHRPFSHSEIGLRCSAGASY